MMFVLYDVSKNFELDTISGKSQFGDLKHAKKRATKETTAKITWRQDTTISGPKRYYGYNSQGDMLFAIFQHSGRKKNPRMTGTEKSFKAWVNSKADNVYFYRNTIRERQGFYSVTVPEIGLKWSGDAQDANEARILAVESYERKKNPRRKTKMKRKKKRSAKQLANDKRLGRMAKARAKAKRGGTRKKVVRKKTARRKVTRRANPKRTATKTATPKRYVIAALVKKRLSFFDGVRFGTTLRNAARLPLSAAKTLAGKANRKVVIAPTTANAQALVDTLRGK